MENILTGDSATRRKHLVKMDSDWTVGNWKGSQYASDRKDSGEYLRDKFTKSFSHIRTRFISEIEEEYDSPEHYDKD